MFGPLLDVQMSFHMAGVRDCAKHGRRSILDRWNGKIAKRIGTRLPALHSTFHFWRKSRRIALFLTLLSSNTEEVSQNFSFLTLSSSNLRKSRRPVSFLMLSSSKIRKSRSIVSFLTLSSSNTEEVSQNSFVFNTNILRYITQHQLHYTALITQHQHQQHQQHKQHQQQQQQHHQQQQQQQQQQQPQQQQQQLLLLLLLLLPPLPPQQLQLQLQLHYITLHSTN